MIIPIIVTHDSAAVLDRCLAAIDAQSVPVERVVIVDSGSADRHYLSSFAQNARYHVVFADNIGFAAANNRGVAAVGDDSAHLLFLNPDAFLAPQALATARQILAAYPAVGALGGRLVGYDAVQDRPTGRLDSTGVFRTWYGRWFDRGQGEADDDRYRLPEVVPALCGAFLLCRREALASLHGAIFDESFFLYKEDIDLCLRLRRSGWQCLYHPEVVVAHCRGWSADRRRMTRSARLLAARSEVRLTIKHRSPYLVWALAKYLLVAVADA